MKEFNYLVEKARMVRSFSLSGEGCTDADCSKCPLSAKNNGAAWTTNCRDFELNHPLTATEIVKNWTKWLEPGGRKMTFNDAFNEVVKAYEEHQYPYSGEAIAALISAAATICVSRDTDEQLMRMLERREAVENDL